MSDPGKIERNFSHHQQNPESLNALHRTREAFRALALCVDNNVPDGREKGLALAQIEGAVSWASAEIARENAK